MQQGRLKANLFLEDPYNMDGNSPYKFSRGKTRCSGPECNRWKKLREVNGRLYCNFHISKPKEFRTNAQKARHTRKEKERRAKMCSISFCETEAIYESTFDVRYCGDHYSGPVCNYINCPKVFRLSSVHGAYWCQTHRKDIIEIRSRIKHDNSREDAENRLKELRIRKDKDLNHIYYYIKVLSTTWASKERGTEKAQSVSVIGSQH